MYESSAVVTSEPPHILFLSPVDLHLSLILCLFHLYLPLSRFAGTRWHLRLPSKQTPSSPFSPGFPPPLLSFVSGFSYTLQNGSPRLSYSLPAGPSVPRRRNGQMFSLVSFVPSKSRPLFLSFMLT